MNENSLKRHTDFIHQLIEILFAKLMVTKESFDSLDVELIDGDTINS